MNYFCILLIMIIVLVIIKFASKYFFFLFGQKSELFPSARGFKFNFEKMLHNNIL